MSWGKTAFVMFLVLAGLAACAVIGLLTYSNAYG